MSLKYSIIIPAWNESEHIKATLVAAKAAVASQQISGGMSDGLSGGLSDDMSRSMSGEIIVVDNNSSDDTALIASSTGARLVFEPFNQIARARNTGAQASQAEWLVFIDADTIVSPELLTASLQALSGGKVIGGGSTVAMDRDMPRLPTLVLRFWNWWSIRSSTAAGCFIYCTKEAFESVGGFDEKRYAAEELYLSKRLRKLAKKREQRFVIQTIAPVVSSARKIDWFSPWQFFKQVLLLLVPGATRSRVMCFLWYDRSNAAKEEKDS